MAGERKKKRGYDDGSDSRDEFDATSSSYKERGRETRRDAERREADQGESLISIHSFLRRKDNFCLFSISFLSFLSLSTLDSSVRVESIFSSIPDDHDGCSSDVGHHHEEKKKKK